MKLHIHEYRPPTVQGHKARLHTLAVKEVPAYPNIDDALKDARRVLKGMGYHIRSLSATVDGGLTAVVHKETRNAQVDKDWVWKRPPDSAPEQD